MYVLIQVRKLRRAVYNRLKARAALSGMSLPDHIFRECNKAASRPTLHEMLEHLAQLPEQIVDIPSVDMIREHRDRP